VRQSGCWTQHRRKLFIEVSSDLQLVRVPLGAGLVGSCAASRRLINVPDC